MKKIITHTGEFEVAADESVLDALNRTGHNIDYQCREGYCGSCRVVMLDGDVEYDEEPLAFVAYNEVLTCCCRAKGVIHLDCHVETVTPHRHSNHKQATALSQPTNTDAAQQVLVIQADK